MKIAGFEKSDRAVAGVFLACVLVLVLAKAVTSGVNHDEHQFIAPGALLADRGLLPYRDYPLFHLPNLSLVFAGLDWLTGQRLLAARLFNALCAFGTVAVVFVWSWRLLGRVWIAVGIASLLVTCSLFIETTGKAWNHDLPVFAVLLGLACLVKGRRAGAMAWLFAGGACVGIAVGSRLTFAPVCAPFLLAAQAFPGWEKKTICAAVIGGGIALAMLPTLGLAASAPEKFYFDNFEFPRLRLRDPEDERARKTAKLWRKLRFVAKEVVPTNAMLFLGFAVIGVPGMGMGMWRRRGEFEPVLVAGVLAFTLAGCLAPTRYQYQHFYAVAPLLALGVAIGFAGGQGRWRAPMLGGLALLGVALAVPKFDDLEDVFVPRDWTTMKAHAIGQEIGARAGQGKVLTLSPIYPIEGGCGIYEEFATGPFAWRLAHLMSVEERGAMNVVAPDDLDSFLAADPPAAVLLGAEEKKLEKPLRKWAETHGYTPRAVGRNLELWLRP